MLGKPVFDGDVLTSNIPSFDQASAKPRQQMWSVTRREPIQEPNHRHRWLLRACRERPCCRAAQQRDNLPSSDHSMAPARELRSIISDWRGFSQGLAAARDFEPPDVWLGSFTSFQARSRHDRFTPNERTYPAVIGSSGSCQEETSREETVHVAGLEISNGVVPVGHPTIPEMLTCLTAGACDMGFLGPDPSRGGVDFSPPILQVQYTFLVPAGCSIQRIADADRPGVRIAVVRDHASTLTLSRIFKPAQTSEE